MGLGDKLKKGVTGLVRGEGNPLADFGALTGESYSVFGDSTAKMLPIRYRNSYKRNTTRGMITLSGNAPAGIFEKSKSRGYTDKEAAANASMFGAGHSQVSAGVKEREAAEAQELLDQRTNLTRQQMAARERGQASVRIRRGMRDTRSTKGGTILNSPGGLGSTGGYGSFAALLGL